MRTSIVLFALLATLAVSATAATPPAPSAPAGKICPSDAQMKRLFHYEKTCLNVCGAYFDKVSSGQVEEWFACSRFGRGWSCNLRTDRCQIFSHLFPKTAYDKNRKRTAAVKEARLRLEKEIGEKVNRAATESAWTIRTPPKAAQAPSKVKPAAKKAAPPTKRN